MAAVEAEVAARGKVVAERARAACAQEAVLKVLLSTWLRH